MARQIGRPFTSQTGSEAGKKSKRPKQKNLKERIEALEKIVADAGLVKAVEYYVYAHYTKQGDLFYIGKGTGERAYGKQGRNADLEMVARTQGLVVKIIADGLTETQALNIEKELIVKHSNELVNIIHKADCYADVGDWEEI